jgi:hypothetical protein
MEMAYCQITTLSSVLNRSMQRFLETSAIAKNMVFNVEKLLNNGVDLALQRKGQRK